MKDETITSILNYIDALPSYVVLVKKLIKILLYMPSSNASAESSFSALNCVKTWLRSVMSKKLNSIAVVHLKKDFKLDIDEMITKLAKIESRQLNIFILIIKTNCFLI